jgi:hypothetical protein
MSISDQSIATIAPPNRTSAAPRRGDMDGCEKSAASTRKATAATGERRRHPATAEIDYTRDQCDFLMAVDARKRRPGRIFPTGTELLEIVVSIGFRRIETPSAGLAVDQMRRPIAS